MTDDLVSRLLAAIREREVAATDSKVARNADEWVLADQPTPAWGDQSPDPVVLAGGKPIARLDDEYGGSFHAEHAVLNDPRSVLRLCQAHRKLVDEYLKWRGNCGTNRDLGYFAGLDLAVRALAEGYGVDLR